MAKYIEREALLKAYREEQGRPGAWSFEGLVNSVPSADVAPVVHGYWYDVFQDGPCSWSGKCSVCDVRNDIPHPTVANYCPHCGAKMDLEG